jgi:LPS-assembly protein
MCQRRTVSTPLGDRRGSRPGGGRSAARRGSSLGIALALALGLLGAAPAAPQSGPAGTATVQDEPTGEEPAQPAPPPAAPNRSSTPTSPPASSDGAAAAGDGRVVLKADLSECEQGQEVCLFTGNVKVFYQDVALACDEMLYNNRTKDLVAKGSVVVDQGPSRFTAGELHYNLATKTGLFLDATGFVAPMYTFSGESIEKLDETHYRIDRAVFTTCEDDTAHPPWSFHLKKAHLEVEGFGRFTSTAIKIQGVPVFYLPYIVWPIKRERSPGLLMPSFGYSDRFGGYLGLPVYFPLGRSWDTTFVFEYFSEGFYGIGNELRWAPVADSAGLLDLYSIYDKANAEWQWRVNGRHDQADVLGFRLQAQLENVSDPDFFQDFDRSFEANTRRDVYTYLYLTKSRGPYSLNLSADHRRTFFTFTDPDLPAGDPDKTSTYDTALARLPEAELRVRSTRLGGTDLYWNLVSSLNLFYVDKRTPKDERDDTGLVGTYWRGDVFPTLNYTLPGPPWLTVTPRIGGRYTYYTARYSSPTTPATPTTLIDEPIDRAFVAGGIDIGGPSVSRVFTTPRWGFAKFKHLIEPRVSYAYLQGIGEETTQIPIADEVDSTPLDNRVRVSLANRLFGRSEKSLSSTELGSFELIQEYSFSRPLSYGEGGETSGLGPLVGALRVTPSPGTGLDARASYDLLNDNLASISLTGTGRTGLGTAGLTWYAGYNPITGDRVSSQARALLSFLKPGLPISATAHIAYDLENGELQQQRYQVGWKGSCWSVSAEYRDLKIGLYPTRDFRILIELKGIGGLPEIRGSL